MRCTLQVWSVSLFYVTITKLRKLEIGTTGVPKGVIRDHAGYATVLNYSMKSIYNLDPGQVHMQ